MVGRKYTWDEPDNTPSQSQLVAELDLEFWVILLQSITTADLECNERERLTVRSEYFQRAGSEPAAKFACPTQ